MMRTEWLKFRQITSSELFPHVPDYGQTCNFLAISHPKARSEATEVGMEELDTTFTSWEKEYGFYLEDNG